MLSLENLAKRPTCGTKTDRAEPEERDDGPPALIPGSDPEEEEEERDEIEYLRAALAAATTENESLKSQVSSHNHVVEKEKARAKEMWRANCEYLAEMMSS